MTIPEFKSKLLRRGTSLNEGLSEDVEEYIIEHIGIKPAPLVVKMFSCFDGFPEGVMDGASGIRIWPLRDVLYAEKNRSSQRIVFADFLLNSNEISFDISDEFQPILYDTGEKIADSLHEFLNKLSCGELDFL